MQGNGDFAPAFGTGSTSTYSPASGLSVAWNSALLAAVFFVGTGGFATAQTFSYVPGTPSVVHITCELGKQPVTQHVLDTQEKLAGIRRYFAMNITDMAKILRVGRPTVYSWLRDDPGLRANHARRIDNIYEFSRNWREMSNEPVGAFMSQSINSGSTLLGLLSAKVLDELAIKSALAQVAESVNRKTRRATVLELAKRRGFKLAPVQPITHWASGDDVDT